MSLTPEHRAEQNRKNAQHSTGPKTLEGKARSRTNALKHGLRVDALPMPGEDPAVAAARGAAWNDHYQPQSPAAHHLVNECVRATLQADRVAAFQSAAVAKQVGYARAVWHAEREKDVRAQLSRLRRRPFAARRELVSTAAGCRCLIERWEKLRDALEARGHWKNAEVIEASRLLGGVAANPEAWVLRLNAFVIGSRKNVALFDRLWEPGRQPECLRDSYTRDSLPHPDEARGWLDELIASELDWLGAEQARWHEVDDLPALEAATALAFVAEDPKVARLHLRYQSEARAAFHRSYTALISTLERDAENPLDADDESSPNEADAASDAAPFNNANHFSETGFDPDPEVAEHAPTALPDPAPEAESTGPRGDDVTDVSEWDEYVPVGSLMMGDVKDREDWAKPVSTLRPSSSGAVG